MNTDKLFNIQKQVRDNVKTMQTYMTDLQNWEAEMKRKEAALKGEYEQDLPPVRSKIKKEKPVVVKKGPENRIKSYDYDAWYKFDIDKACENVDMEDVGPQSLDAKKSSKDKVEKLREEAQYEKERGNGYVKQEKWDEAISCYNRAIELVKDDPIYYANRGLCHLKKDSLHKAEADCSAALRLDPAYVKALQRRAAAREALGSLRAAAADLAEVLRLEPRNAAAQRQLLGVRGRMGTKGTMSKSSPTTTPTNEPRRNPGAKIVELPDTTVRPANTEKKEMTADEKWMNGLGENITVIKTVTKPPHLRSKRALMNIPIQEIPIGKTAPEKTGNKMKIIEIEDDLSKGDTNNNEKSPLEPEKNTRGDGDKASRVNGVESVKLASDVSNTEFAVKFENLVPPVNSVQFMAEWKKLAHHADAKNHYLSIIDPSKLPSIFANALESDVLSELLRSLHHDKDRFAGRVAEYLKAFVRVKRFSALAMFLTGADKELVNKLLVHCATLERCPEEEIAELKEKFEL